MNPDSLIKRANQIGRFFDTWPDRAAARREVATHLARFWGPRLRQALLAHVAASVPASGLLPLVEEAVAMLSAEKTHG